MILDLFSHIQVFQLIFFYMPAVVCDNNMHLFFRFGYLDRQTMCSFITTETIFDRIFHKWLQQHLVNLAFPVRILNFKFQFNLFSQFFLLEKDVFFQPSFFRINCGKFTGIIDRIAQDVRKCHQHLADLILFILNCFPVDRIQNIIKEMWIDLSL